MFPNPRVLYLILIYIVFTSAVFASPSELKVVKEFINAYNIHQYQKAYNFLSTPLKEEVPYEDFLNGAEKVEKIKVLQLKLIDRNADISKLKLKVKVKEWEEGELITSIYTGKVTMILEHNCWKFIQIEFQKLISLLEN